MKKILNSLVLTVIFVCTITSVNAQLVDYKYQQYKLGFKAPANFTIVTNTETQFTVNNGKNLTFSIYPYRDNKIDDSFDVAFLGYEKLNCTEKMIEDEGDMDLDDYEAYFIVGACKQTNKEMIFIVLGAIDPDSDVNFYAVGQFWADDESDANIDILINLMEKIYKIK